MGVATIGTEALRPTERASRERSEGSEQPWQQEGFHCLIRESKIRSGCISGSVGYRIARAPYSDVNINAAAISGTQARRTRKDEENLNLEYIRLITGHVEWFEGRREISRWYREDNS